jgi:di/tricarboxylate transporter/uncharacterized membrane protein YbhN (UPF0104 family)
VSHTTITFFVLAGVVVAFVLDRLPVAVVAMGTALSLWATGVLDLNQALAGFGDPAVLFIASLFVVSESLDATGITAWAGQHLVARVGESRTRLLVLTLLLVAGLTALISVNGAVAALLPVAVLMAMRLRRPTSQLLLPLAFGAHAGSLLTLSGSPVNVIASEFARDAGAGSFGYFSFALVGVPLAAGTIAVTVLFGERLLPHRTPKSGSRDFSEHARTLVEQYGLDEGAELLTRRSGVAEVVIPPRSQLVGDTAFPGMATDSGDLVVLAVQRKGEDLPGETVLIVGDTLLLEGAWGALEEHLNDPEVLVVDEPRLIRRQVPLGPGATRALVVLAAMVVLLATGAVPPAVAGLLAAGAIVVGGVLTVEQAYRGVSWTTVILVAGMIPLSTAMIETGAAARLADVLVDMVGGSGPPSALPLPAHRRARAADQQYGDRVDRHPDCDRDGEGSRRVGPPGVDVRDGGGGSRAADARRDPGQPDGDGTGRLPLLGLLEARTAAARPLRHRRSRARARLLAVLTVSRRRPEPSDLDVLDAERERASDRRVGAPAAALVLRFKFFAAPPGQPRARRGTDVVLLVPALLGLVLAIAAYPPSSLEQSLETFLAGLPGWLDPVWGFLSDLLWLWALVLVAIASVRVRLVVVAQALAALVLGALLALWATRLATGSWPELADAIFGTSRAPRFPATRVAEATAVLVTVGPHLSRPVRTFGRWLLLLGLLSAAISTTPLGTFAAAMIAVAAAAAIRLASGTSVGRPGLDDVAAGLAQLGIRPRTLEEAERQVAGVFHIRSVDEGGQPLLVKVYGRDAYDTQLVARVWRRLWYRGAGPPIRFGRLEAAEHEAFVTLLVRNGGLASREVVTAAATIDDDALLVLRGEARPLASLERAELVDALLRAAWDALNRMDELRIAHQQIDAETVAVIDGDVGFIDFGAATVAPTDLQLATDRAQLFLTTASLAGGERAIRAGIDALGADGLATLLPYLQSAAFTTSLRQALERAEVDVDELRERAAQAVGVEPPELAKLRRVSVRALVQIALFGFASYTILDAAAGVDWGDVASTIRDASWGWIAFGLVVAQLPRLSQALSTLGSVPTSMPYGPVYAMQLATGYMNVALPSNLARMAVNIRFFQRQGLTAPTAVASGVIDSLAGTSVQALLLCTLLIFSESSLPLEFPVPSGGFRILLWILLAALAVSVVTLVIVRRLRDTIMERIRRWWPDVRATLVALRASHKLALLLLGSLATELLFAIALGLFARSFGAHVNLAELLVINISVSLLASFIPVPGGIGVVEFGLTIGLSSAGMTPETAIAAVLLYRIATYYLPPTWGFPAMLWLQRSRYL